MKYLTIPYLTCGVQWQTSDTITTSDPLIGLYPSYILITLYFSFNVLT